jgi:NAD(P)H dehydrogenase (quinone)
MKINIIYSNHHHGNFNEELLEKIKAHLLREGHEFVVRDLYKLDFNPVLKTRDFELISSGNIPEDIGREQDFVRWADMLIFIYPVWWGGMPAIVKGYIDRIFSWGFAYKSNGNGPYPLLTNKKVMIMSTMGQSREEYENGMFQSMNLINTEGIFGFCGIEVVGQHYFTSIHNITQVQKEEYLDQAVRAITNAAIVTETA